MALTPTPWFDFWFGVNVFACVPRLLTFTQAWNVLCLPIMPCLFAISLPRAVMWPLRAARRYRWYAACKKITGGFVCSGERKRFLMTAPSPGSPRQQVRRTMNHHFRVINGGKIKNKSFNPESGGVVWKEKWLNTKGRGDESHGSLLGF